MAVLFAPLVSYPTLTTWDPANKNANVTLSNFNRTAAMTAASFYSVRAIKGISTGKFYWEIKDDQELMAGGIVNSSFTFVDGNWVGINVNSYGYVGANGTLENNSVVQATYSTYTTGDTVNFALDMTNAKFYIGKNGTWQNSGNPDAGTGSVVSGLTGTWYPAISNIGPTSAQGTADFGITTFTNTPSGITTFYRGVTYQ